jgi:hypothetical protein
MVLESWLNECLCIEKRGNSNQNKARALSAQLLYCTTLMDTHTRSCSSYRFTILLLLLVLTPLVYIEPRLFGISLTDAFHLPKQCLAQICALALVLLFAYEITSQGTITLAWGRSMYGLALFIIWSSLSLAYTPAIANGLREIMRWVTYGVILFSSME